MLEIYATRWYTHIKRKLVLRVYKTKYFHKWAKKALLSNEALILVAEQLKNGLVDAYLGGNLYKKRVPLINKGKRGGFRTLLAYRKGERSIFLYGFEKNDKDNIDKTEEEALKKLAKDLLIMTQVEINFAVDNGELIEVML